MGPADAELAGWCSQRLGSPVATVLFEVRQLSRVLGVRLSDGREVVVKARPWEDRVVTCVEVQRALADRGFPCPPPLAAPEDLGGFVVSVEEYRPGGEPLAEGPDSASLTAGLLAELVTHTPDVPDPGRLVGSSPPWVGWDHPGIELWPARDTPGPPLVVGSSPGWIDRIGSAVRAKLRACTLPLVLGHGDWESHNLSWVDRRPYAVHDWDSLIVQPEPAVAGAAAAVWPSGLDGRTTGATVEESVAFLEAYQAAAGIAWDTDTEQLAWAAGLWVRAFNAKKDAADGAQAQVDGLAVEADQRCRRAGLHMAVADLPTPSHDGCATAV